MRSSNVQSLPTESKFNHSVLDSENHPILNHCLMNHNHQISICCLENLNRTVADSAVLSDTEWISESNRIRWSRIISYWIWTETVLYLIRFRCISCVMPRTVWKPEGYTPVWPSSGVIQLTVCGLLMFQISWCCAVNSVTTAADKERCFSGDVTALISTAPRKIINL